MIGSLYSVSISVSICSGLYNYLKRIISVVYYDALLLFVLIIFPFILYLLIDKRSTVCHKAAM